MLNKGRKGKYPMSTGILIRSPSLEQIIAARESVLTILKSCTTDEVRTHALDAFRDAVSSPKQVTITDCSIDMGGKAKKPKLKKWKALKK